MSGSLDLNNSWRFCRATPGECAHPEDLQRSQRQWLPASVPGTVASALRAADEWTDDSAPGQLDDSDWWFELQFAFAADDPRHTLEFAGLATVAEVWLNGQPLLQSDNMYLAQRHAARNLLRAQNTLHICFRSLSAAGRGRKPRPRWRTPLVTNQQLRWFRATLLGRISTWRVPACVGPWRPIRLVDVESEPDDIQLRAQLLAGVGRLDCQCKWQNALTPGSVLSLVAAKSGRSARAAFSADSTGRLRATLELTEPELWWPHTHGEPALYDVALELIDATGSKRVLPVGRTGFRSVELQTDDGRFAVSINDLPVFCRGAIWTPLDPVSLCSSAAELRTALQQVRDAGLNMLRISGAMVYEERSFYALCDELGILIWQDFMFANMDFPADDADFLASVTAEVEQFLGKVGGNPCIAVLCGNSEVEQQAAMSGAARELWQPSLFHVHLRQLCADGLPHIPYWPSSTHGGAFPHEASAGSCSYYGVGAYRRSIDDARLCGLSFAAECLGFANEPGPVPVTSMHSGQDPTLAEARWRQRAPRDPGSSWDFVDVRDHYFKRLFGLDPAAVLLANRERYLELSRLVGAEVSFSAMAAWRRAGSNCGGALVWFLRDLWQGAGWGLVDADGEPKATFYYLKRLLQPLSIWLSDEGCNGLALHWSNESLADWQGQLEVTAFRHFSTRVAVAQRQVTLPGRSTRSLALMSLFDYLHDFSFAYRFGEPQADLLQARLSNADGTVAAVTYHLPLGVSHLLDVNPQLSGNAVATADGEILLTLHAVRYAHAVTVVATGHVADDQYLAIGPGGSRSLRLRPRTRSAQRPDAIFVKAVNSPTAVAIELRKM